MQIKSKKILRDGVTTAGMTLQHLLVALPAMIAVPVLFGAIVGLNQDEIVRITQATVLISGLMTLLHGLNYKGFGSNAPMVIGADLVIVAVGIRAASQMNLRTFFIMIAFGSVLAWGIAYFLPKRLKHISPTVIIATMLIYSLSFLPVALDWFLGGVGSPDYGSLRNILVGAAVLSFTLFLNQYGRGILKFGSIALGMILGCTISLPLGLVKWSEAGVHWFSFPKFMPYIPTFSGSSIVVILPILIVLLVKQLMDLLIYSKQMELTEAEEQTLIQRGMKTNAIGYLASFFLGGVPTSAQVQNFGINSFLQKTSKKSIVITGIILVVAGFMPKIAMALIFIPLPVLGALGLLFVTSLFNMTIEVAKNVKWSKKATIVLSLSFVFGLIALLNPDTSFSVGQSFRIVIESGICISFFTGLFLELVIPEN